LLKHLSLSTYQILKTYYSSVVIASDFSKTEEFTNAIQAFEKGKVSCCWKRVAPSRKRIRDIHWDPENPPIDLCIVLDTTASMGGHIAFYKEQVQELLRELSEWASMPVACSFVSYKDFGNSGHLETHPWSNVSRQN